MVKHVANILSLLCMVLTVGDGILQSLRDAKLHLKLIRRQAYDGATSMSSAHVGAQAVAKEASGQNAHYVHCHSHKLNLSTRLLLQSPGDMKYHWSHQQGVPLL